MSKTPYLKSQTRQTDWCVVIPKLPDALEARVAEKLIQEFSLTSQEAQDTIQHTPIILLDDLDHETAAKVKAVFDGTGVELILTQEPSFKKKCFRVLWPKESSEILSRWKGVPEEQGEETLPTNRNSDESRSVGEIPQHEEQGAHHEGLKKRLSELEARLKIAEARDKELQGELEQRERNSRTRDEVLQQEKKVSQKLQSLFSQGQKEAADWQHKAERAQDRIKGLEAEKKDLSEKLQVRVREIGNWKVKADQIDAEREDLSKQLEQQKREGVQRQQAFEQQLSEFVKKNARDKTGYVDEKKQWSTMHEQFQHELRAAQQKSAELTDQIKALRRNITDREEASKLSAQTFKDLLRKNQQQQQKITQMEGQLVKLEKNRDDLTRQLNQVAAELVEKSKLYENAVSVYENRMQVMDTERKSERSHFEDEKLSLAKDLENLRAELAALERQKTIVQDNLSNTEKRCGALEESIDLQSKEQQAALVQIDQLKQTEIALVSEVEKLQSQNTAINEEKAQQAETLQSTILRLSEIEQTCARQQSLLQTEAGKLMQERDSVERGAERIRQLESEQFNLEKSLEVSTANCREAVGRGEELQKTLSDFIENQKRIEQVLSDKVQELAHWHDLAGEAEAKVTAGLNRIAQFEALKKQADEDREKLAAAKAALEQQCQDQAAQVIALTQSRDELMTHKKELQNQMDELGASLNMLRGNLDKRTQDLETSLHEREKQSEEWAAKYGELKEMADAERETFRLEHSRLESVLQAVREEKTAALKDVCDLESGVAELERKRAGLASELSEKTEQLSHWTLAAEEAEAKAASRYKTLGELENFKLELLAERDLLAKAKDQLESEKQSLESRLTLTTQERDQLILLRQKLETQITELQEVGTQLTESLRVSIREREVQDENWSLKFNQLKESTDDERQVLVGEKQQLLRNLEGLSDDKEFAQKAIQELEERISELHETRSSLERQLSAQARDLQQMTERAEESSGASLAFQNRVGQLEDHLAHVEEDRTLINAELEKVRLSFDEVLRAKNLMEGDIERWSSEAKELQAKLQSEMKAHELTRHEQSEQNACWTQKYNELAEKSAEASEIFEDERQRYEISLAEIKNDKAEAFKEIGRLEERIESLDQKRRGLEDQLSLKTADYENYFSAKAVELQQWIQHAEQADLESTERQKRIDQLEITKAELEGERQNLTEALVSMSTLRDAVEKEKQALSVSSHALEEKADALAGKLAEAAETLQARVREGQEREAAWTAQFRDLKDLTDAQRETLTQEKLRLEALLIELENDKVKAGCLMEAQESSLLALEKVRADLEQNLKTKMEELQQWMGLAEQAEMESATRQNKLDTLEMAKAGLEDERASLLSIKEDLESQIELFKKNLSDLEMERESLLEIKQGQASSMGTLESQLKTLREEFKELNGKLSENIREKELQTAEWTEKYEQLKVETDAQCKMLTTDQQRLTAALNSMQADKSESLKEIGRLEGRIESLDETCQKLERSLTLKSEELSQWTQLAEQSEGEAKKLTASLEELFVERDHLTEDRDRLMVSKNNLESERDNLLAAKEQLEKEREQLNQNLLTVTAARQELEEWKENLETEVEKLEEQSQRLKSELEKRTEELETARLSGNAQDAEWSRKCEALTLASEAERERLSQEIAGLRNEKAAALSQIQQLHAQMTELDESQKNLSEKLRLKTEELSQWTELAEQSETKAEERQAKIQQLESERESLASAKTSLIEHRDQLLGINASLENERDGLLAAKEQLSQNLLNVTAARQELEEWKENLETEVEKLEGQSQRLKSELEKRTEELETARLSGNAQDAEWSRKCEALTLASEAERERLSQEIAGLRNEKAAALSQIKLLHGQMTELDESQKNLSEKLRLKTEELSQWTELAQQGEAKSEEQQAKIHALEYEREQLNQKIAGIALNESELQRSKHVLETSLKALEDRSRDLSQNLKARTEELEKAQLKVTDQEVRWRAKYTELTAASEAEIERLGKDLEQLKEDRETKLTVIPKLESRIRELTDKREGLEETLREKSEELAQWAQRAEENGSCAEERQKQINSLHVERDSLVNEKTALIEDRDRLLAIKNDLTLERDELTEAKEKLETERVLFANKLAEVSEIRDDLEQQRKNAENELKKLKNEMQRLNSDLDRRTQELSDRTIQNSQEAEGWASKVAALETSAQSEKEEWRAEQSRLTEELQNLSDQRLETQKTVTGLEAQIKNYEARCKAYDVELQKKSTELEQWSQLAEQVEAKAEAWHSQVEELEKAKQALEALCDALRAAKTQLDQENQDVLRKLEETTDEKDRTLMQRQGLQAALKETQAKFNELQKILAVKEAAFEQKLQDRMLADVALAEKYEVLEKTSSVDIQSLSEELEEQTKTAANLKLEEKKALEKISQLERRVEVLDQSRGTLEEALGRQSADLKNLQSQAAEAEIIRNEQKKKLEALEKNKDHLEFEMTSLLETKNGHEADLRDSNAELQRLKQLLLGAETAVEIELKRSKDLDLAKTDAEDRCQKLERRTEEMIREKKTLVQQVVEIQAGLNSLEMENSLTSLESRRKFLEAELDARAKEVEKWMETARLAEIEIQRNKDEQLRVTEKNERLEKQCSNLESELQALLKSQKQNSLREKEISQLEAQLKEAVVARDAALQEAKLLSERNDKKTEAVSQDWDQRYAVLQSAMLREREGFDHDRAELYKKQEQLRKIEDELSHSQGKVSELEASRNDLQNKLEALKAVKAAVPLNAKSEVEQSQIQEKLRNALEELEKLKRKYHALEDIKSEFVGLLGVERQRYDDLQSQYDQLKNRFGELVRRQTESISIESDPSRGKAKTSNPHHAGSNEADKMLRLKQILDFEDKRSGSKE